MAWSVADEKTQWSNGRYKGYIRNSISSPIDVFTVGAYAGIAEYWQADRPIDEKYRLMPVIDGLDISRSVSFLADEDIIYEGRGAVKFMSLLRRKPGLTPAAFSCVWRDRHAALVRSVDEVWRLFRGYKQPHVIPGICRKVD